ncbi:unnamed protein product, partial [Hapterophycus canaliculatus]
MEYRMMNGKHRTPNAARYNSSYHHRRTRSALPISRADAAARAIAIARGVLPDEDDRGEGRRREDGMVHPPSSFWKPTPTA